MEPEIETNSYDAPNRIIKEFEKRAKEAAALASATANGIPSKTTRLIEKFEKKAQGLDERTKIQNGTSMVHNMKKVFEPTADLDDGDGDSPDRVIPSGSTNKLIGMFQQPQQQQMEPQQS